MFRVADFGIILRAGLVMANPAEMSEHLPSGDGPGLLRKRRTVFLHRRVEIELAALPESEGRGSGERLGDRTQTVERVFTGRDVVFKIGESESLSPLVFAVLDDGHREARDMGGSHELEDSCFDLGALFGSEFGILRDATRWSRETQRNHKREMNPAGGAPMLELLMNAVCHKLKPSGLILQFIQGSQEGQTKTMRQMELPQVSKVTASRTNTPPTTDASPGIRQNQEGAP